MTIIQYIGNMETSRYVIKKEFLDTSRYSYILKHATEYESLFKDWLGQIILFYRITGQPINMLPTGLNKNLNGFAQKLQNQMYPFIQSMCAINNQHLDYISGIMRLSAYGSLERDTDKLIQSIQKLHSAQLKFQGTYRQLLSSQNRLILSPTSNLEFYFHPNWVKRNNALQRYLKQLHNLQENKPNKDNLYKLSEEVQNQLLEYRKKIINYKYGYLKQGVKLARKLLNCLAQYLAIGSQILIKVNGKMKLQLSSQSRTSNSFNQQMDHLQQFQQNFVYIAEGYRQNLKNMKNLFVYQYPIKDSIQLYSSFSQYYAGNEHLLSEMFDVFKLYESLALKRKMLTDKTQLLIKRIQEQYRQKKKTAQVLNAISKRRSLDPDMLANSGSITGDRLRKSQQFSTQPGVQNIQRSIASLIQFSMEQFRELTNACYKVNQKYTQNRASKNNMSISYEYKQIIFRSKRPSKQQLWLWRDWRDFRVFQEVKPKHDKKFIQKQLAKVKKMMNEQETDDKESCQLQGRYTGKARLQIYPEKVKVKSKKDEGVNMLFPFSEIEAIEPHKKKLILKFNGGSQVKLSSFKNYSDVQNKLNQYLMNKGTGSGVTKPRKPAIQITNQQLQAIKTRKSEIEAARQKLDDPQYRKFAQGTMAGVTIQQVYEQLYSDKGQCAIDKNNSFFKYLNLKNGQKNVVQTKFDRAGPYFYTGENKQITFVNCPIFSTKFTQLDHTLPPIPFIPKTCHCKSEQKLFWVSDKQLQYTTKVMSSGAKMMQSFYTVATHRIKEIDTGVHIELWNKIIFVKDTSMKTILKNGGEGQLKNLMPKMIAEMQKCMKAAMRLRTGTGGGQVHEQQTPEGQTKAGEGSDQKNASKIQLNRYLILIVMGTILINILINLIF